jgi:hypothetical protein
MLHFAKIEGLDIETVLSETVDEVLKRDWIKNKDNGLDNKAEQIRRTIRDYVVAAPITPIVKTQLEVIWTMLALKKYNADDVQFLTDVVDMYVRVNPASPIKGEILSVKDIVQERKEA